MADQQDIALTLQTRKVVGKGLAQLRHQDLVPAVIHDHGRASVHVEGPYMELYKVYRQAGKHHPIHLTVDGKKFLALIRDADFEPRKNQLRHLVFNAVEQNKPVETEVPVVFEGDSAAEKAGLMVLRQLEAIAIKALPKDLPDQLTVNVSSLAEVGDKLHVSDIALPSGVELVTEPEHALAIVEESRAQAAAEAEEAEAAEAAAAAEGVEAAATETADSEAAAKKD